MEIKDSITLPKTEFSMKADLPNKEPDILNNWIKNDIYTKLREQSASKRNLFFMTDHLMQMDICTWAMRSIKS